jgi:head-tail adaptor
MQSGNFDTRVQFQERVKTSDGGGGFDYDWQAVGGEDGSRWAAVWAKPQGTSDEEATTSRVINAPDYRLIVRIDPMTKAITTENRVLVDGVPMAITSITRPDRSRQTITMIIQEGKAT